MPATVARALTRRHLPPDLLWLEVTESAVADAGSMSTLFELHELGVHLAIDDFGTGWSSMSRLSEFPWDALKIDRSFVTGLAQDAPGRARRPRDDRDGPRPRDPHRRGRCRDRRAAVAARVDGLRHRAGVPPRSASRHRCRHRIGAARRQLGVVPELALTAGLVRPVPRTGGIGRVSALAQRLQGFNDLGAVSPDLLVATGPDGIVAQMVDPAWETMLLDGPASSSSATTTRSSSTPTTSSGPARPSVNSSAARPVEDLEARWRHEDGRWRWISWASHAAAQQRPHLLVGA